MTKTEFVEALRKSLYGKVDDNELAGNISYYSSYIDNEILSGRSEQEVIEELGDPRLIAKTIVETYKPNEDPMKRQYTSETQDYQENTEPEAEKGMLNGKLNGYLKLALIVLVIIAVLSVVFKVILALLPALAVVLIIIFIVKMVR